MNKQLTIFGILILFLIPIALAVPPVTTTAQPEQYDIIPKLLDAYKVGTNISLEFHTYNSTGYLVTNVSPATSCDIHIYKMDGSHYLRTKLVWDGQGDWETKLSDVNTTALNYGAFPYIVWCNSTTQAGWLGSEIILTQQGIVVPTDHFPNYDLILVFGLLTIAFFLVFFSDKFKVEGENYTRAITALSLNLLLKLSAFALVLWNIMLIKNVIPSISSLQNMYDPIIQFSIYGVGMLFFVLYFINSIATLALNWRIKKELDGEKRKYG